MNTEDNTMAFVYKVIVIAFLTAAIILKLALLIVYLFYNNFFTRNVKCKMHCFNGLLNVIDF